MDQHKVESYHDLPLHYQNLFKEISRCAEKCLNLACQYGRVLIITNSDEGWVNYSAERFLPHMLPILERNKDRIKIVSARTRYESFYPDQPLCWKAAAFAHEVNECFTAASKLASTKNVMWTEDDDKVSTVSNSSFDTARDELLSEDEASDMESTAAVVPVPPRQVLSFGDSMEERNSVRIVSEQLNATDKSVMFLQCPSPEQIIGQLAMITGHMDYICTNGERMDLEIGAHQAAKTAERYFAARASKNTKSYKEKRQVAMI